MPHNPHTASSGSSVTNSLAFKITMLLTALLVRLISVAEGADYIIHFKSPHRYMIVVPVRVNGTGPYSFLLDTGATSSAVDPQLSTSLHLSAAQGAKMASWEDTSDVRRVFVQNLSLGAIDSGPLSVLVQPLSEFKAFDSHLRGVLGQDMLLPYNYLIDNRHHLIQFDKDSTLLPELTGDRISITPVATRAGALEPRLIAILVQTAVSPQPLHLLLDSGADMVVLQPRFVPANIFPRGVKWMADENGRSAAATTFHTILSVGSEKFSAETWIGNAGLSRIVIDGLLPTGTFNQLYIANQGSFVIFEPGRMNHKAAPPAPEPGPPGLHP